MKFSITINQKMPLDNGMDLDIIDLAIFEFIKDFSHSSRIQTIVENGKTYYWISYQNVIDEMPILWLKTKDPVYRRIKKLASYGILEEYGKNSEIWRSYFAFWPKYDSMVFSEDTPGSKTVPPRFINRTPPGFKTVPPPVLKPYDKDIIDKDIIDKDIKVIPPTPKGDSGQELILSDFQNSELSEKFREFEKHRKELKEKLTPTNRAAIVKKLSMLDPQEAIDQLQQSIENGWRGIFPVKADWRDKKDRKDAEKEFMSHIVIR